MATVGCLCRRVSQSNENENFNNSQFISYHLRNCAVARDSKSHCNSIMYFHSFSFEWEFNCGKFNSKWRKNGNWPSLRQPDRQTDRQKFPQK